MGKEESTHRNNDIFKLSTLINTLQSSNLLVQGMAKEKERKMCIEREGIGGRVDKKPGKRYGQARCQQD